tara:strand:- start:2370 stop:2633 length:264 start_codon:yes stop_codon:yes gene_type:complete
MTKIYIYCLFDKFDNFLGVYSSLKAVHRDAIKICNKGGSRVFMTAKAASAACSLTLLRNTFKGVCDLEVKYQSDTQFVKIYKTKLRE